MAQIEKHNRGLLNASPQFDKWFKLCIFFDLLHAINKILMDSYR